MTLSRGQIYLLVPAVLLALLAATTLIKTDQVLIWQLSILGTEFGHWFAAVSLILLAVAIATRTSAGSVFNILLLSACTVLFTRPFVQAQLHQAAWKAHLQAALGVSIDGPLVSFGSLWSSSSNKSAPEIFSYEKGNDSDLTFDFYRTTTNLPAPWVLVIHGGGWDGGNTTQLSELNRHLAERGVAVASINYRLAPAHKWPAQRDDAEKAAAYIKTHAKELNIDPTRWVVLGRSAGGQIAEALAYQKKDASLKGVIAYYSPADLNFAYKYTKDDDIIDSRNLLANLLGGTPDKAKPAYDDASPIQFVSPAAPPTLLFHGRPDPLTWVVQSRRLFDAIKSTGGRVAYIELPWATHAFDFSLNGPGGQVATRAVDGFLATVFKK